jgi:ABC-type branched-subunit amino acid transport system permease subunit
MQDGSSVNRKRRLVYALSGAADAVIGAVIVLFGFGLFPMDPFAFAFSPWYAVLIGGAMLVFGLAVAVYNFMRLEE